VYGHYGKQLGANGENIERPTSNTEHRINPSAIERFKKVEFATPNYPDAIDATKTEISKFSTTYALPGTNATVESILNFGLSNKLLQTSKINLFLAKELDGVSVKYPADTKASSANFFSVILEVLKTNGVQVYQQRGEVWVYPASTSDLYLASNGSESVRKPLPEKAPADQKWISPFGPLTTKAAAKAGLKAEEQKPFSLLYTYSLIIALVCGTAGLPHILVRFYTNPDGVAAKRTTMWVMILIGIFYVFPPVFGVMGRNLLPELYLGAGSKGSDKVVLELPRILNERVPMLGSILSGITCAGAFAAFMSTFSGLLVSMTGALAHDVYGRILRPKSTPEQRMRMFKFGAVIIGGVAILLGMQVEQLEINFMVGQAFAIAAASYFPLLFMSVWWRGMTQKGAATGMLTGGLLALAGITLTSVSDIVLKTSAKDGTPNPLQGLENFWIAHPGIRILCEQPAIWAVPLAITLMIVVSKLTRKEIPSDVRMKMLVLHAPEKLGLKQEYIQEHQGMGH
jgi:cation/acetate symporter